MYEVVRAFYDSKNDNRLYEVGDTYPVADYKPTKARIEELAKGTNVNGKVYLRKIEKSDENISE